MSENSSGLQCSFCGKTKEAVQQFISGPSVYICNECVTLCNEILGEEEKREAQLMWQREHYERNKKQLRKKAREHYHAKKKEKRSKNLYGE